MKKTLPKTKPFFADGQADGARPGARERLRGRSGSLIRVGSPAGFANPAAAIFGSVAKTQPSVKVLGPRMIAIEPAVMGRINAPTPGPGSG
jgi:hypothetical protein